MFCYFVQMQFGTVLYVLYCSLLCGRHMFNLFGRPLPWNTTSFDIVHALNFSPQWTIGMSFQRETAVNSVFNIIV